MPSKSAGLAAISALPVRVDRGGIRRLERMRRRIEPSPRSRRPAATTLRGMSKLTVGSVRRCPASRRPGNGRTPSAGPSRCAEIAPPPGRAERCVRHGWPPRMMSGMAVGIALGQRRRQQDVVELAQMPLLRPARVVERPAVELRPPLDDVFAKAAGQQHVEARAVLRRRPRTRSRRASSPLDHARAAGSR